MCPDKLGFEESLATKVITPERCVGCGACVVVCPYGCLEFADEKPRLAKECKLCGLCAKVCPRYEWTFAKAENFVFGRERKPEEDFGIYRRLVIAKATDNRVLKVCQDGGVNYPNNPTAGIADKAFLRKAVDFAVDNNMILCYDNAYSEISYEGYKPPSILEIDGAMDVAVEFHSCSKTFSMTGDRIAFAVGNAQLINGLAKVKSQVDSGPPVYTQKVAAKALQSYTSDEQPNFLKEMNQIYRERRDLLVETLCDIGFNCNKPKATFYVWVNCKGDSIDFATQLLNVGVAVTPGVGFGKYGEGYVRMTFTQPIERIKEACRRIASI